MCVCFTELFTGNTMKLPAAIYEGKTTFGKLCHNWFWSYLGNFVGSLALVWLVVQSGVLAAAPGYAIKTAMAKGTLPWMQVGAVAGLPRWLSSAVHDGSKPHEPCCALLHAAVDAPAPAWISNMFETPIVRLRTRAHGSPILHLILFSA